MTSRPPSSDQSQYTLESPPLDERNAQVIAQLVQSQLAAYSWQGRQGGPGMALTQLFGRMTELIIARLNRVPEKHFLAFLNEAGIDLLAPQPASAELTFTLPDDYPGLVRVPAGTQVATVQTETQPEVIFETQQDINVVPTSLIKCIAFDPVNYSDYTAQAKGEAPGPFAAFQGQQERERILYLADDELLAFADESSRQAATITLSFQFDSPGNPTSDGWRLEWLYWNGTDWAGLEDAGAAVFDDTNDFSQDGYVVFTSLPELMETEVEGQSGLWIACQLTGGSARNYLPSLQSIEISRQVDIDAVQITADGALSAIHAGAAFVPLDPADEFFPLGQRPGRLDTFYLRADEAFTKGGAFVEIEINLEGVQNPVRTGELEALTLQWEYYSSQGWTLLGNSGWLEDTASERLDFRDTTQALTTRGIVAFRVPEAGQDDPPFSQTAINGQEGYWLRARVTVGSYDEPGGMIDGRAWNEPRTHAPLITRLTITYGGYSSGSPARTIPHCLSRVDNLSRDHASALASQQPFAPFDALEKGPALYLGFSLAFPAGEWMQILLDVAEEVQPSLRSGEASAIFWEYWNGSQWSALRVSDNSRGLRERGFLGFFGPDDHQPSAEFGQSAYWFRARPPRPPQGNAGNDQELTFTSPQGPVTLDAAQSQAFDRQSITRYRWRLVSSKPPKAKTDQDIRATTGASEATVTLDASASQPVPGRPIVRFIWRRVEADEAQPDTTVATPFLNSIRTNIVPALNAISVRDEALGSSNGKAGQTFSLLRTPALPGVQVAVREPDRPPSNELAQLQEELSQQEPDAQALLDTVPATPGQGVWVRWHQVEDFYFSNPSSRHFTLDPISGQIRFGDGSRGKIPPVGRDNIRALIYRTHNGVSGNVAAGNVTALRNPRGDLANIKVVTNHEATGGGADQEPVEQVKLRGPQTLKHRQRAVAMEDYEWLAREAGGDLAQVWCLPTRNPLGLPEAGWVTVVITPESATDKRPSPTPALLRRVEAYLKDHALTNLTEADQIYVKGPEYIEASVLARVVPTDPSQADDVELAVLEQLETFLHPLWGGPQRAGWELGRDVYISEIYTEIEAVPGVDHVAQVRLSGSLQQVRLHLALGGFRQVPFDVAIGSQVSTFDERIKLLLAEPLPEGEGLTRLSVYGFKAGDRVAVVAADNTPIRDNLTISAISGSSVVFVQSFSPPTNWARRRALLSSDERVRLPLLPDGVMIDPEGRVAGVTVSGFRSGDQVSVVSGGYRHPELEFLPVERIEPCEDRIFVPEGHLIYSGTHDIEIALE